MNVYLTLIPERDRHIGEDFVIQTFGIPDGFSDCTYREHLKELMGTATEYYITDHNGLVLAYVAWNITNDIHRRGDILDVHQLILHPGFRGSRELLREVWTLMKNLAYVNKCDFISHYKHVNSSIINHITRRV